VNPDPGAGRTHRWQDWDLDFLLRRKQHTGLTRSLVVPARNEAATVGQVVGRLREALMQTTALLDEIVVSPPGDRPPPIAADRSDRADSLIGRGAPRDIE